LLALLSSLVACGPNLPPISSAGPADLPTEAAALEGWLTQKESTFSDIIPGAEKSILWADPETKARTPLSIVYLHGYSACRQEVSPLIEDVAAELGANVFFTRLTGHGRGNGPPMADGTVETWVRDGYEALAAGRLLGERTVVIGTSTGATLAAWLAAQPETDIAGLVLMSPNFEPKAAGSKLLVMPGRSLLVKLVVGAEYEWEPRNEQQAKYWSWRYPSESLFAMMELVTLVDDVDLGVIKVPTLVIYSPNDQVVQAERVEERFPEFGSSVKKLVPVEDVGDVSNHVLAGDILAPEMTGPLTVEAVGFLREAL